MNNDLHPYELGMPVLDVAEVVRLEQEVAESGTSLLTLMVRAGHAVAAASSKLLHDCEPTGDHISSHGKAIILAGSGNNGGDGWVAASDLAAQGFDVMLVSKAPAEGLTAEPARTAAVDASHDRSFQIYISPPSEELGHMLTGANLIVDAILGTGFAHSEVRPPYDEWIELANAARSDVGVPILAVDCPSGLDAQSGTAARHCVRADETVTMIAAKAGLVQASARRYVGDLLVAPIGIDGSTKLARANG